jgi:hypothetical protein
MLALPSAAKAVFEAERFAAARKDDRSTFSAALFGLNGGDVRSVELPGRGHEIALKPDSSEWVTFDGCGLTPTHQSANFLLTSGAGWLVTADSDGEATRQSSNFSWDNHAILVL